jgi:hypothetical protein
MYLEGIDYNAQEEEFDMLAEEVNQCRDRSLFGA